MPKHDLSAKGKVQMPFSCSSNVTFLPKRDLSASGKARLGIPTFLGSHILVAQQYISKFASDELKNDKEIFLKTIQKDGLETAYQEELLELLL